MSAGLRQRGAAVILAMLIVALAAMAAVSLLQQQDLALRQLTTARDYEQATWVLKGGAQWARSILWQDGRASRVDHTGELWASGLPATDIEQGTVGGEISDQQGLFNVNNLALEARASARDIEAFRRLLAAIGLNADLAQAIADWIDADGEALPEAGVEDEYYLRLPAPYRAANQPVVELGELLRVRGMDEMSLARLRAFATALPRRTPVNVNLASPELLHAMVPGLTLEEARVLAASRAKAPFRSPDEFQERLPRRDLKWIEGTLSVGSEHFMVRGRATVGRADVRMEALLQRDGATMPVIVWQRMQ
ncbi:MAG: type II secretion system minor pseudopilin GspK [Betaproteobacteria bacterium]|nr:type II secretion system minor pseudopilin GspK [Betaproteobacteria bacterium]MDH5220171.1 type II secretion system minor pseudopilin GspK [Betaproteobacteria bacterium]MDH5352336.1 type II secretion system minor pseudopilin GspK [Betaproteobacteria bacterium]